MALLLGVAGPACADDASAVATDNPASVIGTDAKAWQDAMQALKAGGYDQGVLMQAPDKPGTWIGSARDKNGERVDVAVDAKGNVTRR